MFPRQRHSLLLLLLGSGLGCSLVTKPNDSAARCETAEDCDQPEDSRYQTVCEFGDEGLKDDLDPADVDMVCVGAFAVVSCEPSSFNDEHPVTELMDSRPPSAYASLCDGDKAGSKGCPPPCDDGLSKNAHEVCDDDDDDVESSPPAIRGSNDVLHQDILDQFCRSFFCDREFVCDTDGHTCKTCKPDEPHGTGGCRDLYIDGALSCVYMTAAELKDSCQAPDSNRNTPDFGDCS